MASFLRLKSGKTKNKKTSNGSKVEPDAVNSGLSNATFPDDAETVVVEANNKQNEPNVTYKRKRDEPLFQAANMPSILVLRKKKAKNVGNGSKR